MINGVKQPNRYTTSMLLLPCSSVIPFHVVPCFLSKTAEVLLLAHDCMHLDFSHGT